MITKTMLENFRGDFKEAVKDLESKYGVTIHLDRITYGSTDFEGKIKVKLAGEEGEAADREKFEASAKYYGFEPGDYNREFILQGRRFRLTGFNPRSPKNDCQILEIDTGKLYKCNHRAIKF